MDLSQISVANLMQMANTTKGFKVEEDLLRHMVIDSIRSNIMKFKHDFGKPVIACDSGSSWRKSVFPYYKASREKDRAKSPVDWATYSICMRKIIGEITEFFPYPVVRVKDAEGDDVISVLTRYVVQREHEEVLIISGDKDFVQLHALPGVTQFNPVAKAPIFTNNADLALFELVCKGDRVDGIPNIKSSDDVFVTEGTRQAKMYTKDIETWYSQGGKSAIPVEFHDKYDRNERLIDLSFTPVDYAKEAVSTYRDQTKKRSNLREYFYDHGLVKHMQNVQDFII